MEQQGSNNVESDLFDVTYYLCFQFFFEIILDGEILEKYENENPLSFNNVKVWAAKAKHGFPAADAFIGDFVYENIGMVPMTTYLSL